MKLKAKKATGKPAKETKGWAVIDQRGKYQVVIVGSKADATEYALTDANERVQRVLITPL